MMNRKGTFKFNHQLILKNPEIAKLIMNDVIVIRAENCFATDEITYWAYSEHFDELGPERIIPEYEAIITDNKTVTWRKVE
jgi:hypothetical protein